MKRLAIILALLALATAAGAQTLTSNETSKDTFLLAGLSPDGLSGADLFWTSFSSGMNLPGEPLSRLTLPAGSALLEAPKAELAKLEPAAPAYTYREQKKPALAGETHRFFDRRNAWLAVATVGVQTMDAVSTRYTLDHYINVKEGSPVARPFENAGWPGTLAFHYGINAGGTLLFQYMAHRSGHHRLERWLPVITIGQSLQGSLMNFKAQAAGVPKK
jgi:hypothetical protein